MSFFSGFLGSKTTETSAPPKSVELAEKHVRAFYECLTAEGDFYISKLPPDALSPSQREMLRRWAQQLGNNDDQEDGPLRKRARLASDEPPATPTAFRRVGRPRKSEGQAKDTPVGSRSWGFILALQKIEIPSVLAEQLHPHKSHNPAQFLADVAIPATEGAPKLDVLIRLCGYVHEMPRKEAMDTVCRLFFVLMLADMASYVFEEEDWWNQRNHGIEEKVRSPGATGKTTVNMIKQAGQLAFICQQLSTGCLFCLYSELGENFLRNRVTTKGKEYDKAMEHVKSLGLLEKIKANGADQFGDAIRRHLRRQYQINLKEDMEASDEGQSIPRS